MLYLLREDESAIHLADKNEQDADQGCPKIDSEIEVNWVWFDQIFS